MKKNLLAAGAAAASLILATPAAAAQAAPTYDVAVGGSTAFGDHAFSAPSARGVGFGTLLNSAICASSSTAGNAHSGTSMSGLYTGADPEEHPITGETTTWTNCTEMLGSPYDVTQAGNWQFTVDDADATTAATEMITGTVVNIRLHISVRSADELCNFWISGSAAATFDESTQELAIDEREFDGGLAVESVRGDCLGTVDVGDPAELFVTYAINISDGLLNIS